MNKKKTILAIILVLLVAILVVVIFISSSRKSNLEGTSNGDMRATGWVPSSEVENESVPVIGSVEDFAMANKLDIIPAEKVSEEIAEISGQELKNINLIVSKSGFTPKEIKAKTGQVLTINLGATDPGAYTFKFVEEGLMASGVTVTGGYSLGFNVVAPLEAGIINFFDEMNPENTGKIIVE